MDNHLEQYLDLCERIAKRLEREGKWPFEEPLKTNNSNNNEQEQ